MMDTHRSTFDPFAEVSAIAAAAPPSLDDLTAELEDALDRAIWAFDFQGDLEDALDQALLRSALASTPTIGGGLFAVAAA
jgi:hypothetical protein